MKTAFSAFDGESDGWKSACVKPDGFQYYTPNLPGPLYECEFTDDFFTIETGETAEADKTTEADTTSVDKTSAASLNNTDDFATNMIVYGMAIVVSAMSTLAF